MIYQPKGQHRLERLGLDLARLSQKWLTMGTFALELADLSVDPNRQVGCVIFDPMMTRIWSFGYNGPPTGFAHDVEPPDPYVQCPNPKCRDGVDDENICPVCEDSDKPGYVRNPVPSGMQHAEVNALIRMPTELIPRLSAVCWVTLAPCDPCARHIIQSGAIGLVVYGDSHDKFHPELLTQHGIAVVSADTLSDAEADRLESANAITLRTIVDGMIRRAIV